MGGRRALGGVAAMGILLAAAAGCGGGSTRVLPSASATATPATPTPSPSPAGGLPLDSVVDRGATIATGDDWTTFAHDDRRTAVQHQPVGFDRSNVASLRVAWRYHASTPTTASPLAAGGSIYVATWGGDVIALDAATGTPRWSVNLGGGIRMTPTLADGTLFVATHDPPATFAAIDAATGTVRWRRTLPFALRSEPVVASGVVVMGLAGGDPPQCRNGGVTGLAEASGATLWTWTVSQRAGDGGSVWGPISTDGVRLYFGTGNTCTQNVVTGNAVINLGLDGAALGWNLATVDSRADDDIGGGILILGNRLIVTSKDATLRAIDANSGMLVNSARMPAVDGYGGYGTPTTDGATLFVSAGWSDDPTQTGSAVGTLLGYDANLHERWRISSKQPVYGYVAIASGMGFVALDDRLVALDPASGATLWSANLSTRAYASVAVVPSGLYAVDDAGDVYAFRPGAANATTVHRRLR